MVAPVFDAADRSRYGTRSRHPSAITATTAPVAPNTTATAGQPPCMWHNTATPANGDEVSATPII